MAKICKDCEHYRDSVETVVAVHRDATGLRKTLGVKYADFCASPQRPVNLVTGEFLEDKCVSLRQSGKLDIGQELCGIAGLWWQQSRPPG